MADAVLIVRQVCRAPFFFRYNDNSFTDPCLCITARDQQHLAQASIQTQLTSLAPDSSRLSAAQTGFTAQPCIHAERQLIASIFTAGDDIKPAELTRIQSTRQAEKEPKCFTV